MKIIDRMDLGSEGTMFAVELEEGFYIDVKACPSGLVYVMQNEDGSTVYDGRFADYTFPGFEYDEKAVLNLVREAVLLNEGVLEGSDVPAMLVEEVSRGEFRRYALTPEEFEEKFGQPQVVGFSSDGWEAFSVESFDFWCRCGVVGDDIWAKFFTDMTYGLSKNDIAEGFRASVREDLMGDLRKYLPGKPQNLKGLNNMDERFEELKRALFMGGLDAIEDFLGYEIDDEDKDVIENRLDMAYEAKSDNEMEVFYERYGLHAVIGYFMEFGVWSEGKEQPPQKCPVILVDTGMRSLDEIGADENIRVLSQEQNWYTIRKSEFVLEGNVEKIRVAIESTDDYSDSSFYARLVDFDIQNEDGTYGRVVESYRIVRINENGRIDKLDERVFESAQEVREAVLGDGRLELVSYDDLVHEAGKGLGVVLADAQARAVEGVAGKTGKDIEYDYQSL